MNSAFLATKIEYTHGQEIGTCQYPTLKKCTSNKTCNGIDEDKTISLTPGICESNGYCRYDGLWCPYEDPYNSIGKNRTQVWEYDITDFTIWVKSSIVFPQLDPKRVHSTINKNTPTKKSDDPKLYNLFPLSDLLDKIDLDYSSIKKKGCILELKTKWKCDLNTFVYTPKQPCQVQYEVKRLDNPVSSTGFNFRRTIEYSNDDSTPENVIVKRHLFKYYGIRLVLTSQGEGYRFSVFQVILQLSSFFALLVIATIVCDLIISLILKSYKHYKHEETNKFLESCCKCCQKKKTELEEEEEEEDVDGENKKKGVQEGYIVNDIIDDNDGGDGLMDENSSLLQNLRERKPFDDEEDENRKRGMPKTIVNGIEEEEEE